MFMYAQRRLIPQCRCFYVILFEHLFYLNTEPNVSIYMAGYSVHVRSLSKEIGCATVHYCLARRMCGLCVAPIYAHFHFPVFRFHDKKKSGTSCVASRWANMIEAADMQ